MIEKLKQCGGTFDVECVSFTMETGNSITHIPFKGTQHECDRLFERLPTDDETINK